MLPITSAVAALMETSNVPHNGSSPGDSIRPRRIATMALTESTSRYNDDCTPAMAETTGPHDQYHACEQKQCRVRREEGIECGPKQVEGVVVQRVTYCAEPEQHAANTAGHCQTVSDQQQWHGNDERDPVIAVPRGTDPFHVAILSVKQQAQDGLKRHPSDARQARGTRRTGDSSRPARGVAESR